LIAAIENNEKFMPNIHSKFPTFRPYVHRLEQGYNATRFDKVSKEQRAANIKAILAGTWVPPRAEK
jgi:hypothetical protein